MQIRSRNGASFLAAGARTQFLLLPEPKKVSEEISCRLRNSLLQSTTHLVRAKSQVFVEDKVSISAPKTKSCSKSSPFLTLYGQYVVQFMLFTQDQFLFMFLSHLKILEHSGNSCSVHIEPKTKSTTWTTELKSNLLLSCARQWYARYLLG